jgi:predicted nucleotidyltransferase
VTAALGSRLTPPVEAYVSRVAEAIAGLRALYLLGSAATGGFNPETSDLDVVAVVGRPLSEHDKRAIVHAVAELDVPVRRLELVVYAAGSQPPEFDLNLNADERGARELQDEPRHWFVIDAALAQEHAVALSGPPWAAFFAPLEPERVRQALEQSLAWSADRPGDEFARLNAIRARHYLDHGEWIGKREAEEAG